MSIMLDPVAGAVGASQIALDDLAPTSGAYYRHVLDEVLLRSPLTELSLSAMQNEERLQAQGLERRPLLGTEAGRQPQIGRGAEVIRDWQPSRLPAAQRPRLVPIEEANERGRAVGLTYDRPVPEGFLQAHIAWRRRLLQSQEVFERARADGQYGTGKWLLAGGIELLASAADPFNVAAAMLPVVREARFAIWSQRIGRVGASVAKGTIEGATGNALLEGALASTRAGLDPDYTMAEAMLNIAVGGALGGGLHLAGSSFGAARDGIRGYRARRAQAADARIEADAVEAAPPETRPATTLAEAVDRARPETRDAALRVGLAQLNGERALDVEAIVRADPSFEPPRPSPAGTSPRRLTAPFEPRRLVDWPQADSMAEHAKLVARAFTDATRPAEPPADFTPSADVVDMARRLRRGLPAQPEGREPQTLSQWIAAEGGVMRGGEGAGELLGQDLARLVRGKENGGRSLDDLALAAVEEGFYPQLRQPDGTIGRPELARFIDDIVEDAAGRRRTYSDIAAGDAWRASREANAAMRQWLKDSLGVDVKALTPRQLQYLLSLAEDVARDQALLRRVQIVERMGEAESREAARALDAEIARAIEAEEIAVRRRIEERQQFLEPEEIDADLAARLEGERPLTLQELEALHAERERVDRSGGEGGRGGGQDAGPGGASRPAADRVPDAPAGAAEAGPGGLRREGREGTEGAQGRVTERTDQGQQYLLDGIAAITDAERARAGLDAPLRGGDGPLPEGGLFDITARNQADLDDWLKRQGDPLNDRHADPAASERAARDAQSGDLDARAELDALMAREGKTLSDADKAALEAAARPHEEMALAVEALAQCRIGGGAA